MPVRLQEGFLVDILRILLVAQHMQSEAENRTVVPAHELIKGTALAPLRLPDEFIILKPLLGPRFHLRRRK